VLASAKVVAAEASDRLAAAPSSAPDADDGPVNLTEVRSIRAAQRHPLWPQLEVAARAEISRVIDDFKALVMSTPLVIRSPTAAVAACTSWCEATCPIAKTQARYGAGSTLRSWWDTATLFRRWIAVCSIGSGACCYC
jgi:hypothetical protein